VSIVIERHENVLLVPNRALRLVGGQRSVVVVFEGQQVSVPVTLGLSNETNSEVMEGALQEGDAVVLNATTSAQTGFAGGGGFIGGGGFTP
jgi:multidrug efflux pump subunit AcrA (membrane-fusion protein)